MALHACINEQNFTCFTGEKEKRRSIRMFLLTGASSQFGLILQGSWAPAVQHFKTKVQLRKVPFHKNLGESKYGGEGLGI